MTKPAPTYVFPIVGYSIQEWIDSDYYKGHQQLFNPVAPFIKASESEWVVEMDKDSDRYKEILALDTISQDDEYDIIIRDAASSMAFMLLA